MRHVANPIYDVVFKFMIEDEVLSALDRRDDKIAQAQKEIEEKDKLSSQGFSRR